MQTSSDDRSSHLPSPDMNRTGRVPVETAHLFRPLFIELLALLRGLEPEQWHNPTSAPDWSVKDVVAHLLDGDLRRLSAARDGHRAPPPAKPITDYSNLVAFLNALNAEWVIAARRLSPRVLCDLLERSGSDIADLMESAEPWAPATFPVAWAGHVDSPMWMDIAREYTERWHHQDQIREAVGAAPLRATKWLRPALEVSLFALPHAYRAVAAPPGATVHLEIRGEAGGDWHLRHAGAWTITAGRPLEPVATIRTGDLELTRLLMHRVAEGEAHSLVEIEGDATFAAPLLAARAVMV